MENRVQGRGQPDIHTFLHERVTTMKMISRTSRTSAQRTTLGSDLTFLRRRLKLTFMPLFPSRMIRLDDIPRSAAYPTCLRMKKSTI